MRVDADSGTIEVGKRADLAILDKDRVSDIHNIRSVRSVVANGILDQLLCSGRPSASPPYGD